MIGNYCNEETPQDKFLWSFFFNVYAMKILFVDREACYDICIKFLDRKCIHR